MTKAERMLQVLYKKRTGRELTPREIKEATRNVLRFVRAVADSESTPQRDFNKKTD
jgi:hypothetical protein